ncbi:amino acid transporter [Penicillium brevicompactum]|uniref:Amino acid transporter n=1 Tax=Penicillium brevicompactum TaxID=5074 RepID=A0A9W9V0Q7_PENBR|nr:amino acid transporter [Penicillium brevicompactum]
MSSSTTEAMDSHGSTKKMAFNESSISTESTNNEENNTNVLKKRFTYHTLIFMFISLSAGWESVIMSLYQVLIGGGPTVLVWGYIIAAIGAVCVSFAFAEYASIWPSAAGQAHWSVALTPPKFRKIVGFQTAWILLWMNVLGNISAIYSMTMCIQSLIFIANPDYALPRWHAYLNSARTVFLTIDDNTGYNNSFAAFCVGMLPAAFGFLSLDISARFSEEVPDPEVNVPKSIFWGILATTSIGLPFVLTIAFCMGDPTELLESPIVNLNPLALITLNSAGSSVAAMCLSANIIIVAFTAAIDGTGSVVRIIMALGRDEAIPYGSQFAKLHPKYNSPFNACHLALLSQISIATLYVGNSTAYYGLASGTVGMQVLSYIFPVFLNLIFGKKLGIVYGPWSMGNSRYLVNTLAVLIYVFLFVIVQLPTTLPVSATNM